MRLRAAMMGAAYAGAATLLAPALRWNLRARARRGKEIATRLPERMGHAHSPRPPGTVLWLHAASVGETVSLLPVMSALRRRTLAAPIHVLITTGTVTSARLLAERLPALALAGFVTHAFAPLDVPAWVARFLDHWRPDVGGFVESEIWPNLLAAARARHVPLLLINARLSDRGFRAWRRLGPFAAAQFGGFSSVQAQSEADAAKLRALGAARVSAPGNLKLAAPALPVDAAELARLTVLLGGRRAWVAASTHPGEEAAVLAAHDSLPGDLVTIIVPRHPDRGAAVLAACGERSATRRALGADPPPGRGVFVGDTMGELGLYYRLADMAFVGGSLVAHGGQNVLEPARLGKAVAVGPHTTNFAEPVAVLAAAGGLEKVPDTAALAAWVAAMWAEPDRCHRMGAAARDAVAARPDLPELVADTLLALLPGRA